MVCFLSLYCIIFIIYHLVLEDACTATKQNDCTNSTSISKSKATFKTEVEQYYETHKTVTEILTLFLGFFVGIMMQRWWDQVSSMPDITQVSMVLNCLVKSEEGSMELKKTILKYCLLSYNEVMIQISQREIKKSMICRLFRIKEDIGAIKDPEHYFKETLTIDEFNQFNMQESHWSVPINQACVLIRDHPTLINEAKDVLEAITKFQESLGNLIHFHKNPFPPLCANVVCWVSWMYLFLGAFVLQQFSFREEPSDMLISVKSTLLYIVSIND